MAVPWYQILGRVALLLMLRRLEIAFVVTQRQDEEQQQVCRLLRSPLEPKISVQRGLCCRWLYQQLGHGGVLGPRGRPCQKQGGEERLVQELLGHGQEDEKGDGSRQENGTRAGRGDTGVCGFLLISCLAGWEMGVGEGSTGQWRAGLGWAGKGVPGVHYSSLLWSHSCSN